jgi:hypothetical protein
MNMFFRNCQPLLEETEEIVLLENGGNTQQSHYRRRIVPTSLFACHKTPFFVVEVTVSPRSFVGLRIEMLHLKFEWTQFKKVSSYKGGIR